MWATSITEDSEGRSVARLDGAPLIARLRAEDAGANSPAGTVFNGGGGLEMTPSVVAHEGTQGLIERIAGGQRGEELRLQLAARYPGASRDEIEEAFDEACFKATRSCPCRSERQVFAWLRTTTRNELADIRARNLRLARGEVLAGAGEALDFDSVGQAEAAPGPEEEVLDRERREEVDTIAQTVLSGLSERQRRIVALHADGYRRRQIAQRLGTSPRTVKRQLEHIMQYGRAELVRLAGRGCDEGEDLVARSAFRLASSPEMRAAELHIAACPRCGALYERLDLWRERVAALVPVPAVDHAGPGFIERTAHRAAEAVAGVRDRTGDGAGSLRNHVVDLSGQVRQHASSAYYRAVDPTPLAGVRPGAAASVVAGCLAIGGGATYCLKSGVDPIEGVRGVLAPAHEQHHRPPASAKGRAADLPSPPIVSTPAPSSPTTNEAKQSETAATEPPPPPPAPEDEFEPTSPTGSATSAQATSTSSSRPAPAPASGPGEFTGP